jgi:multiple sugar transport system permease protein
MLAKFKDNPLQMTAAYFFAIFLLIAVLCPFGAAIVSAFKTSTDFYKQSYTWFPEKWRFQNFVDAWKYAPFGTFMLNSIICAVTVTIFATFVSSVAAFAFARINFFAKNIIFYCVILSQAIPFTILFIPTYILMNKLGLVNTYAGLVLPSISFPMGTFLMRQTMKAIPMDYEYAAMIDGCNRGQMFMRIFFPMTRNTVIALGIFTFMGSWNNYIWPLIIIGKKEMYTLPIGLTNYTLNTAVGSRPEWGVVLCACIMSVLPVFIFYAFASRRFMDGITLSGIKA